MHSVCTARARSVETGTDLPACGRIRPSTFGRNRDSIRVLTTDCQTASRSVQFFDPTALPT